MFDNDIIICPYKPNKKIHDSLQEGDNRHLSLFYIYIYISVCPCLILNYCIYVYVLQLSKSTLF